MRAQEAPGGEVERPRAEDRSARYGQRILEAMREELRRVLEVMAEAEGTGQIGAGRYERVESGRCDARHGYRRRRLGPPLGELTLRVPRARKRWLPFETPCPVEPFVFW